jgi:hypothetical protein
MTGERAPAPDFLMIGSGKSGSTSVYDYLGQHPEIFTSPVKEPGYFACDGAPAPWRPVKQDRGSIARLVHDPAAYQALFAEAPDGTHRGESSQIYLAVPGTAERVKAQSPDVRLFAILRDPVDRAYSAYVASCRDGLEPLRSFEAVVEAEPARRRDGWGPYYWHVERGMYGRHLSRWYEVFPRSQLRVWLYDDLRADTPGTMRAIFEHLGVDPAFTPVTAQRHNPGAVPRWNALNRVVSNPNRLRHRIGALVPRGSREAVVRWLRRANTAAPPPLDPATRRALQDRFADDLGVLEGVLDRDLSGWRADTRQS